MPRVYISANTQRAVAERAHGRCEYCQSRADYTTEPFAVEHIMPTYIRNNAHLIPNYGERYRHGEAIATGFVESTVNQVVSKRFCKHQQMQWAKRGAHLLWQARVKTLNHEWGAVFKRWYPDLEVEERAEAA